MSGKIIFLVLIMLIFSSFPASGEVYVVFTDREFGFWGVRSDNINHTINYTNRTLNINTGDSIEWMNMDNEGDRITIISDNVLWEGGKTLNNMGSKFRFTFNSSGTYRFHIVEKTRVKLNASNYSENEITSTTITYEDEDGELHTITVSRGNDTKGAKDSLTDVVSTERYNYQQQIIKVTGPTIGNGTLPIKTIQKISPQKPSPTTTPFQPRIQIYARPEVTQSESVTQEVAASAVPKPMESYQEFTIYAVLKRWKDIIIG